MPLAHPLLSSRVGVPQTRAASAVIPAAPGAVSCASLPPSVPGPAAREAQGHAPGQEQGRPLQSGGSRSRRHQPCAASSGSGSTPPGISYHRLPSSQSTGRPSTSPCSLRNSSSPGLRSHTGLSCPKLSSSSHRQQQYTSPYTRGWYGRDSCPGSPASTRVRAFSPELASAAAAAVDAGSALVASAGPDIALGPGVVAKVLDSLGVDALLLLGTTVVAVPTCKRLKVSPILGFLGAGVLLNQLGFFTNVEEIAGVSELGILFLLFQMGLELSLDRLKELAKFAFGLGLSQMALCTALFTLLLLPPSSPFSATHILSPFGSILSSVSSALSLPALPLPPCPPDLESLLSSLTTDEGVIIALALSLSSSAFVLNLLSEQKELGTRHGSATLGVLLLQDIAVVPLLAVLPVLEGGFSSAAASADTVHSFMSASGGDVGALVSAGGAVVGGGGDVLGFSTGSLAVAQQLLAGALKGLLGLGAMLVGGELVMKPAFKLVKQSESVEAFMALCLLAVTGTALVTAKLGFSDSLGAFLAGAILSSSHLKEDVQQYTAPFEKLLIGLFFMTTGSSIDLELLAVGYPTILMLLGGLLLIKTSTIALIGPRFGLSPGDSVRTAFLLSQGGEFAFVVLALAKELGVLPEEVNRELIIVVVLSMALTPMLNEVGKVAASVLDMVAGEQESGEARAAALGVVGSSGAELSEGEKASLVRKLTVHPDPAGEEGLKSLEQEVSFSKHEYRREYLGNEMLSQGGVEQLSQAAEARSARSSEMERIK